MRHVNFFQLAFNGYLLLISFFVIKEIIRKTFSKTVDPRELGYKALVLDMLQYVLLVLFGINAHEILFNTSGNSNSTDLTNALTQYIGTILAIFIPIILPTLQKLIIDTTPSVARLVLENRVFRKSTVSLACILLAAVFQYLAPVTSTILWIQAAYFILATAILLIIILETTRLLDTREIIKDYESKFIYILKKRWKQVTKKLEKPNDQIHAIAAIREKLSYEAKIPLESIFQTAKKGITNDQVEITLAGLDSIRNITVAYINIFEYSFQDRDKLLEYLIERFIDLKSAMSKNTHYSVMPKIVNVTRDIATEALKIKSYQHQYNQSYLQLGLITHLKNIVQSDYLLKETESSAMDATLAIEAIGINAAHIKNTNIAFACIDAISSISVFCTKLNMDYANEVAKEANRALINLHFELLNNNTIHDVYISKLAESIERPVQAYIDVGMDSPKRGILSPIIGKALDPLVLMDFTQLRRFSTIDVMSLLYFNESRVDQEVILKYYDEIAMRLNQSLMRATEKKMFTITGDIVDSIYGVCFIFLSLVWKGKVLEPTEIQDFINERARFIFSNAVAGSFSHENIYINEYLDRWVSVVGLYLIIFNTWEGLPESFVNFISEILKNRIAEGHATHQGREYKVHEIMNDLETMYQYLVVPYVWEREIFHNSLQKRSMLEILLPHLSTFTRRSPYGESTFLPHSMLSMIRRGWTLMQPYCPYFASDLYDFRFILDIDESVERLVTRDFKVLALNKRLITILKKRSVSLVMSPKKLERS